MHRFIAAVIASLSALAAPGCDQPGVPADGGRERVVLGDRTFDLELAMGTASRTRGLGGREAIPEDGGMMFVFPDAQLRRFWMYDCVIELDIAFVDPIGFVTAIHTMPIETPRAADESILDYEARLPGYSSAYPAQFAIELQPGSFQELGISVGDRLPIPTERLKMLGQAAEPD